VYSNLHTEANVHKMPSSLREIHPQNKPDTAVNLRRRVIHFLGMSSQCPALPHIALDIVPRRRKAFDGGIHVLVCVSMAVIFHVNLDISFSTGPFSEYQQICSLRRSGCAFYVSQHSSRSRSTKTCRMYSRTLPHPYRKKSKRRCDDR